MADTYVDSSFLLKLYLEESESVLVDNTVRKLRGNAFVSKLTDVEVVSSLRRQLSAVDGDLAAQAYLANRRSGVFGELPVDAQVFTAALRISQHAKLYKLRSLDILHLATATRHSVPTIATFDRNLSIAAKALGLAVLPA